MVKLIIRFPKIVLETPWSNVIRFSTSKGDVYLKQTPPDISEPKIIQVLADQFQANVPFVIAINDVLHCFLMKDAGHSSGAITDEYIDVEKRERNTSARKKKVMPECMEN